MRATLAACFVAAVLVHALILFAFRLEMPARPLPMADESQPMDVALVEAPPEPAPAPAAAPSPSEPAPTPNAPAPAPTPELLPTPEMPTPEPTPAEETIPPPEAIPQPEHHKPAPHPQPAARPRQQRASSMPHSAPRAASGPPGGTNRGGSNGPLSSQARYLSNPKPEYPDTARQMRQQGVVLLTVEVGADGRASSVSLSHGSGFPLLDQAALRTVRRWVFEPARAGGLPVASQVEVPVRFSLDQ